ncbi:beta-1,4-galactosyltransferase galt-1-like, partial [Gastrophryne carolinensis]
RRDNIEALDNRTFIISPYYEPRVGPLVRVLAIIHVSVTNISCLFHCSDERTISVRAEIDIHKDRFGFPYGTADLLCAEPSGCNYSFMSFRTRDSTNLSENLVFEVRNRPPPSLSYNFTVCISTLFGNYNNILQMVQSFEMYKILGATRITIYKTSCSKNIDVVLRHYIDEGILEVVSWPIDRHLQTSKEWFYSEGLNSQISYYGQTAALNDCLYRNMYRSKFVVLNDLDEIILPGKDHDWSSLMERLQQQHPYASVFRFENHVFPISTKVSGSNLWSRVPGIDIFSHFFREPIDRKVFNDRKMIVNPRKVLQTSIHSTLKHYGVPIDVPQALAIIFHCRQKKRMDITSKQLIRDHVLGRYNLTIVPKVDEVIRRLLPQL